MILKLLISISLLTFFLGHVTATSCHELQQSQLNALNERINQMIETISSMLPKSLKRTTPAAPRNPVPPVDYTSISPPMYLTSPSTPQVMYLAAPYAPAPTPVAVTPVMQPNLISTPFPNMMPAPETRTQPEYPYSTAPSVVQQHSRVNYLYEYPPQYANFAPALAPPSYLPSSYPLISSPHPLEYPHPYLIEHPLPAPTYPNLPIYVPALPPFPVPVQMPPGTYFPAYPPLPEVPQKYV